MKKRLIVPALAAILCISTAVGCATDGGKTTHVDQDGIDLYPYSSYRDTQGIYMGDVMPFYDDGVMNIYHLQDKVGSLYMFYHPISRLTTTDYLHYKDEGIALNFEEDLKSPDAALGTGSFIKDKSGKYHCFYTGHGASREDVAPDPLEVVRHATSTDQKTWTKDENFKLKGNCEGDKAYLNDDFRDPYVYYDNSDNLYYMLVTARHNIDGADTGVIKYYASASLDAAADGWEYKGIFFKNDAGTFNMECPSYIELNGYYYLAYSEQGSERVTRYRYKTSKEDPEWKKFERDSIDGAGFYAGRLEKAGDKLYAFAWCARLTNGDYGEFDWGGNLVSHEIVRKENGELTAVMVSAVKDALKTKVNYKTASGGTASGISFKEDEFAATGFEALSGNATRMSFKMKLGSTKGDFGITFGIDGEYNNRLGTSLIAFEPEKGRIACYNNVTSVLRYGSLLTTMDFTYEKDKEYGVEVLYQNNLCTVYLDGKVAYTVRMPKTAECGFAFYSNGVKVDLGDIAFYE